MKNVLVTGSDGQLGSELRLLSTNYLDISFLFTSIKELDITNHKAVSNIIEINSINTIINCAAYTAVDKAETEPDLCNAINHLAVKNLAQVCKDNNIQLIHISTDYVFDGTNNRPYIETDNPNPQCVYGQTKLYGEETMKCINPPNSIIIRTSWVYSKFGSNFVKTMLSLAESRKEINVVADQRGSPTNASDLALVILTILPKIKNKNVELFHYSGEGVCSWYDFALTIFKLMKLNVTVNPIDSLKYQTLAKRPSYSVLNKSLIKKKYNINIPNWKDSIIKHLSEVF